MPSTQEFRRRIKSVNNTKQITKAMEMIASIKMQKATRFATMARAYTQNAWNMLQKLAVITLPENHPLLNPQKAGRTAVILITSDRGLCGSYNSEVIKKYASFSRDSKFDIQSSNLDVIAVGKKGAEFTRRYKAGNLIAEFPGFENNITPEDVLPISKITSGEYLAGKYDRVVVIYSHFESSIKQIPVVKQILPISDQHIDKPEIWTQSEEAEVEYKFEPSPDAVLEGVLKQFLQVQIYGAVLEANASEHSARMVAMKNATDSASDLIDELKLVYNSVRQGNITREIAEISGAAEAMK